MQTLFYSHEHIFAFGTNMPAAFATQPSVITIGTFDGVHLGHRKIISELVARAKAKGLRSVLITFEPHPRAIIGKQDEPVRILTTLAERREITLSLGVDVMFVIEFTKSFSETSAEAFIENVLVGKIGLAEVVIGYDHGFGKDRSGTIDTLQAMATKYKFDVDVIDEQVVSGKHLSSTAIRHLLEAGRVSEANELLGRPYQFSGAVARGAQRGRTIGFPTANLELSDKHKCLPGAGVYVAEVKAGEKKYRAMMNIGYKPTIANDLALSVEVFLLEFSGDLYGQTLEVAVLGRVRDEQKFSGLDELKSQLERDKIFSAAFSNQF